MFVTSNPHITDSMNTPKIMSLVILALLPSLIASIYIFGFRALMLALVCVISAVFFEWAFERSQKKPNTAGDMSAVLTGLLIAMNVPVTLPYWQGVIGSFVAIVIVKQFFRRSGTELRQSGDYRTNRSLRILRDGYDNLGRSDKRPRVQRLRRSYLRDSAGSIYGRRRCGSGSGILSETALLRNGRRLHG